MSGKVEVRTIKVDIDDIESREDGDKKYIKGYAVKWRKLSQPIMGMFVEQFERGAFLNSLLKRGVMAYWNHNDDVILGNTENKTLTVSEDDKGLRFEAELPNTTQANDIRTLIRGKYVKGVSFAFRMLVDEWDETGDMPIRTVKEAELFEISPTSNPAYTQSYVSARNASKADNAYEVYKSNKNTIIEKNAERSAKIRELKIYSIGGKL